MKSQYRSFTQVSTTSLWIIDFLLGRSYIEENESLSSINYVVCSTLAEMLLQNIFVMLNQIIILCGCFKKSSTAAKLCCNLQK